jgi:hypothetical protein
MRPPAAIHVSVALALFAGAYSIWLIGLYAFRVAPSLGANPAVIIGVLLQAVLAAWGFANAFGLLSRRPWARVSLLCFAGVLAVFNLLGVLGVLAALSNLPEGSLKTFGAISELLPRAVLALAGIWWLVAFNREPLRTSFS